MRLLYFDCFAGASGDMLNSTLADLDPALRQTLTDLPDRLRLSGVKVIFGETARHSIRGLTITVESRHHSHHRHLSDIVEIIGEADLSGKVKERAVAAFRLLAEAEAHVHGCPAEKVHFHEVGADDAIIDIVGYFTGIEFFSWPEIFASVLPLGRGIIKAAHGQIPLPGPAVTHILKGLPTRPGVFEGETVTPTGAILLASSARFEGCPQMSIEATGYGAGTADFEDRPNLLRVILGRTEEQLFEETIMQLDTTIDDMNPQLYDYLFDRLYEAGAFEAYLTPVLMKKSRPGVTLTVLCENSVAPQLSAIIFEETTTAGIRQRQIPRLVLPREEVEVETSWGKARAKILHLPGGERVVPEYEDCRSIAAKSGLSLQRIMHLVRETCEKERTEGRS
jgi:uncharacterized protein (TIGR00299 family) protein